MLFLKNLRKYSRKTNMFFSTFLQKKLPQLACFLPTIHEKCSDICIILLKIFSKNVPKIPDFFYKNLSPKIREKAAGFPKKFAKIWHIFTKRSSRGKTCCFFANFWRQNLEISAHFCEITCQIFVNFWRKNPNPKNCQNLQTQILRNEN